MAGDRDIVQRTFLFAVRIVKMSNAVPASACSNVIVRQIVRCGTSVGANVEEAQGSQSKKDFIRRMNIARAEAREALYWPRLLSEAEIVKAQRLAEIIKEADELVRVLTAIVKNARSKEEEKPSRRTKP